MFFDAARACLAESDPDRKCALTHALFAALQAGTSHADSSAPGVSLDTPGRPSRPELVAPRDLRRRALGSVAGRAALLHALAHIEFNAINLAWDAVCRFGGMPEGYYRDWARVADEEAVHFQLLRARLRALGHDYGDFPAHDGLWEMALKTRDDVLLRMALVPRVLEARGLDVTPGMIERLREAGDADSVAVLNIILRDEIGHVAIGTRWFRHACAQRGLEPEETFTALLAEHMRGRIRGPFHREAREQAGFSAAELDGLEGLDKAGER
ncbi:MAG: ferritin-like domain-containing protein [Gammaproteobacteria bacterium]|nr:ferritin-like domain-containing protein [Gammaproteobacteria bacterium]